MPRPAVRLPGPRTSKITPDSLESSGGSCPRAEDTVDPRRPLPASASGFAGRLEHKPPVEVPILAGDRAAARVDLLQHTWNRLVADFVRAVRDRDVEHESVPHLRTLTDGLRTEEIIAAARQSSDARQWMTV